MIDFHDRKRVTLLAFGMFSLFSLLLIQFFKVQVVESPKWTRLANLQHQKVIKEPFRRGVFYATARREGDDHISEQPLVVDIEKFHLYIDPDAIPKEHRKVIADKLAVYASPKNIEVFRSQCDLLCFRLQTIVPVWKTSWASVANCA